MSVVDGFMAAVSLPPWSVALLASAFTGGVLGWRLVKRKEK